MNFKFRKYFCVLHELSAQPTKYLPICLYRNELEEFCQGLQHYKMLELIRAHMLSFLCVFVHGESMVDPVCANYIIDTFVPQFSDVGSNRREKEEDIYDLWVSFVRTTSGCFFNI